MTHILPISEMTTTKPSEQPSLPRECTFTESDWRALAPHRLGPSESAGEADKDQRAGREGRGDYPGNDR
jgi:hypothetical protein